MRDAEIDPGECVIRIARYRAFQYLERLLRIALHRVRYREIGLRARVARIEGQRFLKRRNRLARASRTDKRIPQGRPQAGIFRIHGDEALKRLHRWIAQVRAFERQGIGAGEEVHQRAGVRRMLLAHGIGEPRLRSMR